MSAKLNIFEICNIVSYLYQLNNEICRPAHIIIHFLSAQFINSSNRKHAASMVAR